MKACFKVFLNFTFFPALIIGCVTSLWPRLSVWRSVGRSVIKRAESYTSMLLLEHLFHCRWRARWGVWDNRKAAMPDSLLLQRYCFFDVNGKGCVFKRGDFGCYPRSPFVLWRSYVSSHTGTRPSYLSYVQSRRISMTLDGKWWTPR